MRKTLITALFLSQFTGAEAQNGDNQLDNNLPCQSDCNPFSGAVSVDVILERDKFGEIHPPVPYARLDISRALDPWYDIMMLQLELILPRGETTDRLQGKKR